MAITVTPAGVRQLNYLEEVRTSQGWKLIKLNKYNHPPLPACPQHPRCAGSRMRPLCTIALCRELYKYSASSYGFGKRKTPSEQNCPCCQQL